LFGVWDFEFAAGKEYESKNLEKAKIYHIVRVIYEMNFMGQSFNTTMILWLCHTLVRLVMLFSNLQVDICGQTFANIQADFKGLLS